MNISQRLRTCAKHTALDAVIELLNEAADEIDALHARANGQATQPAEVTDEQIAACVKRASTYGLPFVGLLNPGGTPSDFSKRFTAEILAMRPVQVQVPMTDDQWLEYLLKHANNTTLSVAASVGQSLQTRGRWVLLQPANDLRKLVERAYGITAQAKKETP